MKTLVVCARRYNGHELWVALGTMANEDLEFELISTHNVIADEITFQPNKLERVIDDVQVEEVVNDFDGLMIVSGNMADTEAYWTDTAVLSYVDAMNSVDKPIAAICCSVPTIRNAAEGKKVSYYPLLRSAELLKNAGAILQSVAFTRDANLVTAEHQMASEYWAEEYTRLLRGEDQKVTLRDSGYRPSGFERKPIPEIERMKGDN